jgi:hypothetical protein
MNTFILISPFQNEKDLNGIPKIAACAELVSVLRKSETKALEKICGLRLD